MTKMGGKGGGKSGGKKKKSRQLLDANLPTHCESQIALKNNEERDDEDDDDDSEDSSGQIGVYVDGSASSHYVAPGFRSTNQASSAAAVNLGGVTNGALQVNHSRTTSYESDSGLKMFPTPTKNSSSSNSTNSTSKKGGSGGGGGK